MRVYSTAIRRVSALLVIMVALVAVVPAKPAKANENVFYSLGGHGTSVAVMASGGWIDVYERVTYGVYVCASWYSEHGPTQMGAGWVYLGANDCVYIDTWSQYGARLEISRGTHTYGPGGPKVTVYQP